MSEKLTPQEYLDRYLEPKGDIRDSEECLFFKDGFKAKYYEEGGVIEHEDGERGMFIKYQPLTDRDCQIFARGLCQHEPRTSGMNEFFSSPVYVLQDLQMKEGEEFWRLDNLFPNKTSLVLFNPTLELKGSHSMVVTWEDRVLVFLQGNPTDVRTLLALAHEAGHAAGNDGPNTERLRNGLPLSRQEASAILKSERDAWAFALKSLKPFINQDNKNLIAREIHQSSLASYSDNIRRQVQTDWLIRPLKFLERVLGLDQERK